ncbi:MAG: hypothetical protein WCB86_03215 [Candidatus Dormiibacterota bacterium]
MPESLDELEVVALIAGLRRSHPDGPEQTPGIEPTNFWPLGRRRAERSSPPGAHRGKRAVVAVA